MYKCVLHARIPRDFFFAAQTTNLHRLELVVSWEVTTGTGLSSLLTGSEWTQYRSWCPDIAPVISVIPGAIASYGLRTRWFVVG